MQGLLQPGCLPRVLGELFAGASSGVLRLTQNGRSLAIGLRHGQIVDVEATPGPVSPEADSPLAAPVQERLSSMLRDLGIRPRRRALEDPLAWTEPRTWLDGTYTFEEQGTATAKGGGPAFSVSMPNLIREAVRRIEDPVVVRDALGDADSRIAVRPVDHLSLELTSSERAVLSQVDGVRTVRDVVESSTLPPQEAEASLFCLVCMGAVEQLPRAAEEPVVPAAESSPAGEAAAVFVDDEATAVRRREIQEALLSLLHADHFEVLGIPRDADDAQVKEAYLRQVKRLHPDRYADPAFDDLKLELQALFIRVGEAYEALCHRGRRARYAAGLASVASPPPREISSPAPSRPQQTATDAIENALMAEDAILRADQHMLDSRYWDAIQILEAVIPWILAQSLKHAAQVRLARAYAKNPYWVRRGEDLLQTVVREDPARADAYFVLGTIYRGNGLRNRAKAMFRKVLDLKPNHGPAAAEIRSLEHPAPSKPHLGRG